MIVNDEKINWTTAENNIVYRDADVECKIDSYDQEEDPCIKMMKNSRYLISKLQSCFIEINQSFSK